MQTVEQIEANNAWTLEDAYQDLSGTMAEVRTRIEASRTIVSSLIRECNDPAILNGLHSINSLLWVALTAWEEDPDDCAHLSAAPALAATH